MKRIGYETWTLAYMDQLKVCGTCALYLTRNCPQGGQTGLRQTCGVWSIHHERVIPIEPKE
jgi:hypothetical protein